MKLRGSYKLSTEKKLKEQTRGAAVTAEEAASTWCEKGKLVLLRMMCRSLEPTDINDLILKIVYHLAL